MASHVLLIVLAWAMFAVVWFAVYRERKRLREQRDQLLHLLSGGTLTEAQVIDSGLGVGVLSEQRHHEAMRCKAEESQKAWRQCADLAWEARQQYHSGFNEWKSTNAKFVAAYLRLNPAGVKIA